MTAGSWAAWGLLPILYSVASTSQDDSNDRQSTMKKFFQRISPGKRRASPTSQSQNTTTVPSTSASHSLSVSPAQGTSPVDLDQSNQPSTVPCSTGISEDIGHIWSCPVYWSPFADHNSPLHTGNRSTSNPTSNTTRGGMYWILASYSIANLLPRSYLHERFVSSQRKPSVRWSISYTQLHRSW